MGELFSHKGTAYLAPSRDVNAFAEGIGWFVEHPAEAGEIGRAAWGLIKDRLNPDTMIRETLSAYGEANVGK